MRKKVIFGWFNREQIPGKVKKSANVCITIARYFIVISLLLTLEEHRKAGFTGFLRLIELIPFEMHCTFWCRTEK